MRKASPPVARALRLADGSHFALQYHGPGIKRPPVKAESLRDFTRRLGHRQSLHRLTKRRIAILLAGGWRFTGRANDDDDLSLGRSIDIARGKFGEATGHSLFKRLADLADYRCVAVPQNLRHRAKAVREARAAFVEDQRRPHRCNFAQRIAARLGLGRKESDEEKAVGRSEEHTSELQSLMRISYAVFCLKKKK